MGRWGDEEMGRWGKGRRGVVVYHFVSFDLATPLSK
jgi:hypothetical protein